MGLLSLPLEVALCIADLLEDRVDIWSFAHTTNRFRECLTRHGIWRFPAFFLKRAIRGGWNDLLERVLQAPVEINMASEMLHCHTPLSFAICVGRPAIVGTLLQHPNIDIHSGTVFWKGKPPLQQATMNGNTEIMSLLLSHPDMDVSHASDALWTAVESGKEETVETLLQHDVDPNQYRSDGSLLAHALRRSNTSATRLLMADKRTDLDIFYQETRYSYAEREYRKTEPVPIILTLMEKLPQDDLALLWSNRARVTTLDNLDESGNTALHLMARRGHMQWCQTLLTEYPEMLYMANKAGCLPLSIAMECHMTDICDFFCRHDAACYQTPDFEGKIPLVRVIRTGDVELLRRLQLHKPIKEQLFHSQGFDGTTPLMEAIRCEDYEIVKELVNLGIDPNIADEAGYTPLMEAIRRGHYEIFKESINRGVDPNLADEAGYTPLMEAIRRGHYEIVRELINRGVDLNVVDEAGYTPLMEATRHGHYNIIKELINRGVDPNIADKTGCTSLILAVHQRSIQSVKTLLSFSNVDVNKYDILGWNAMIWAKWPGPKRKKGSRKAFRVIEKLLIARGANLGLLLDNAARNERPSVWRMWFTGSRRGTLRRRALISDA